MKDITNRDYKGQLHGYQEWYYSNGNLVLKCYYNNYIEVDYEERYRLNGELKVKNFHI